MAEVQQGIANIELVQRALGASTNGADMVALFGDEERWAELRDAMAKSFTEDCVFAWVALGQRVERQGADGLRAGWLDWFEPWAEYRSHVETLRPVGDDKVLALARQVGVRHEGTTVEMRAAAVVSVRGGQISAVDFYATPEDAFAVVGDDPQRP